MRMSELYALPEGWEWKKLGEVVDIIGGGTPSKKDCRYYDNGTIAWASVRDMNTDIITDTEIKITQKGIDESSTNVISKNAIVIATRVGLGKVCFLEKDTAINQDLKGLLPNNLTTKKYLFFYFKSIANFIVKNGTGATVKGVKLNFIKNLDIPLPPLQEQKRIVAKLDSLFAKIDQAIALHQQNIDEAEGFMGSVLNEVFGALDTDKKISLKDITTKIGSGSTPRGGQKSYKTEGISLIRSMNVHDMGFRTKGLAFIDDEQAKKLNNVTIEENDVLLNITGASVARCCIVDKDYIPARVNQHVSILRLKEDMFPKFLHYYLISPSVKAELLFNSSGGATREAITKSMLENIEVPFISLETQQKTVQYLDQLSQKTETLKQVQTQKMESLKALKASILDKAFRGEL